MGLFLRAKPQPEAEARSFSWPALHSYLQQYTSYGEGSTITIDTALRASAVWGCVRVLAGSVSMIPLDVIRVQGDRREAMPTPALISQPSVTVDRDVWLHQLVSSMTTDGNAFCLAGDLDGRGIPKSLETLDPDIVTGRECRAGIASALIDGKREEAWPHGRLWIVPGAMVKAGSPFGLSPVQAAATGVDASLLAETFGRDFFSGGGHPSSLLYSDDPNLTPDQAAGIKRAFVAAADGREPAVLGSGLKYERVQTAPNESQFLDLLRFEVENACRYFGVPPAMVYAAVSGQSVTYSNVSQADLHYLKHSLEVPLTRIENALSRLLPKPQVAKFNRAALLKSDTLARYEAHQLALRNKWRSVNEVRKLEDEPPFPGPEFDEPGIPGGAPPAEPVPVPAP